MVANHYTTTTGCPQGCGLSSICFSLFVSDLPKSLLKVGPKLGNQLVNYVQYADDLVIISRTPQELQRQLVKIEKYCKENDLVINVKKTEAMIFYKGSLSNDEKAAKFYINGSEIKKVNEFKYLGFTFTSKMSFSEHTKDAVSKALGKIGKLYGTLKSKNFSLKIAKKLFNCYVSPIIYYGLPIYLRTCSKSSLEEISRLWTKYLKRYLGIPYKSSNAITYYLTQSFPLEDQIKMHFKTACFSLEKQLNVVLPNYNFKTGFFMGNSVS